VRWEVARDKRGANLSETLQVPKGEGKYRGLTRMALVSSAHHALHRSGILDPQLTRHATRVSETLRVRQGQVGNIEA
jgi:hypothetical protein